MDMEITDFDESLNGNRREASRIRILSPSSNDDFVSVNNEVKESFTEVKDFVSESEK